MRRVRTWANAARKAAAAVVRTGNGRGMHAEQVIREGALVRVMCDGEPELGFTERRVSELAQVLLETLQTVQPGPMRR